MFALFACFAAPPDAAAQSASSVFKTCLGTNPSPRRAEITATQASIIIRPCASTPVIFGGNISFLLGLPASTISTGTFGTARLGSGTASSSTYLRGDGTWASLPTTCAGGGTLSSSAATITTSCATTSSRIMLTRTGAVLNGVLSVSAKASGSFTVESGLEGGIDNGTFDYVIIN